MYRDLVGCLILWVQIRIEFRNFDIHGSQMSIIIENIKVLPYRNLAELEIKQVLCTMKRKKAIWLINTSNTWFNMLHIVPVVIEHRQLYNLQVFAALWAIISLLKTPIIGFSRLKRQFFSDQDDVIIKVLLYHCFSATVKKTSSAPLWTKKSVLFLKGAWLSDRYALNPSPLLLASPFICTPSLLFFMDGPKLKWLSSRFYCP